MPKARGFKIEQVPDTSAPQGMLDLLSGHTDFMVLDGAFASTQKDKLQVSCYHLDHHVWHAMPVGLTMIDFRHPRLRSHGMGGPAWFPGQDAGPTSIKASALLNQVLALEQTRGFSGAGRPAEPWSGSPASLAAVVPKEMAKWGDIIRTAKIELR